MSGAEAASAMVTLAAAGTSQHYMVVAVAQQQEVSQAVLFQQSTSRLSIFLSASVHSFFLFFFFHFHTLIQLPFNLTSPEVVG